MTLEANAGKTGYRILLGKRWAWGFVGMCALSTLEGTGIAIGAEEGQPENSQSILRAEEGAWRAAVQKVSASVVRIETLGGQASAVGKDDFTTAPTTGVIVDESGLILTSALQFATTPPSILVLLPSGERKAAELVARDHSRQLVLLRIKTDQKLVVPEMVTRESLWIGQSAIAVGRALEPDQPTMSLGIISAKDRVFGRAIQTDAKISPLNYGGPLIDLQGRVIGILTPLSAQGGEGDQTGTDWYDVGIGFAVPLDEVKPRLAVLARGEDLWPGLMGISLSRGDMYSLPAEITGCRLDGPAGKAGLQAKDKIVEVDGKPIVRQAQLKHALGGKYAGDTVSVTVARGEERLTKSITLVDKIEPYDHPFLGVLPFRDPVMGGGVGVRYVYTDSPAAKAGIEKGDVITGFRGEQITSVDQLYRILSPITQKEEIAIEVRRGGEARQLKVFLGQLPSEVPAEIPSALAKPLEPAIEKPVTGVVELRLPQQQQVGQVFVPDNYRPGIPHGLVVWFYAAGEATPENLAARFAEVAGRHQFLVLASPISNGEKWVPEDLELTNRFVDVVMGDYTIDDARLVTYGFRAEGAAASAAYVRAYLDRVHGMALVDSPPLRLNFALSTDQALRMSFFMATAKKSKAEQGLPAMVKMLKTGKLPVTLLEQPEGAGDLKQAEMSAFGRWLDTLDRL